MTEIFFQSALAASKSQKLAADAAKIKSSCLESHSHQHQHSDTPSLLSCPPCYESLLDALRARYLGATFIKSTTETADPSTSATSSSRGVAATEEGEKEEKEWFSPRRPFLSDLAALIDSAREYQVSPQAIDERIRAERARWYAERVRGSLLRLLVEDPSGRGEVFEKLEDLAAGMATAAAAPSGPGGSGQGGVGDPIRLAEEIAERLRAGPLAPYEGSATVGERLASVTDPSERAEVLKQAFFANEDNSTVPADHQKYFSLLLHGGLSMDKVVDRILEDRQAAAGAREQTDKLNQRLDELRRARAAHELQKSRKAQRRESLAQQRVPEELYNLPACAVCGELPGTREFFVCSVCVILAEKGVLERPTVWCSGECEERGHASHTEQAHLCASASHCLQLHQHPDQPHSSPLDVHFCAECLTTLKQPTLYCTLACADADFQHHREEVHLPERRNLGLPMDEDEDQLEYLDDHDHDNDTNMTDGDHNPEQQQRKQYRARDITAVMTSLEEAVKEWEGRNRVRMQ